AARGSTVQHIREQRELSRDQKLQLLEQLKVDLLTQPELPIRAYYLRSQQMQNRHATTFVKITGRDFIEESEQHSIPNSATIINYLEQYQAAFTHDWFIRPIRDYLRLHFAGVHPLTIAAEITDYDPQQFAKKWRSFQTTVELLCYQNKRLRKHLSPLHRLELKFLQRLKKRILEKHPDGKLTATELREHTNTLLQYHRYRGDLDHPVLEQSVHFTAAQLERRLQVLFEVEVTKYNGSREYVLEVDYVRELVDGGRSLCLTMDGAVSANLGKRDGCDVPFCERGMAEIVRKPLRVLDLYR
ncbi:MAG: hypothetical protein AB8G22_06430, partial [Saprospiraceae bacterium]